MKTVVVGAGALGLYMGAKLQRAGNDLRFLLRSDYDVLMEKGLRVNSIRGDFHLDGIRGYRSPEEIGPVELVLVCLKTTANHRFADLIPPLLDENTVILTLQNGLGNEEQIVRAAGSRRVVGGVAYTGVNRDAPGSVDHVAAGHIKIGADAGIGRAHCEKIAAMFTQADIPCEVTPELEKIRWEKLAWNIPFNGLCALTGRTTEELMSCPALAAEIREIIMEVIAGGNSRNLSEMIPASLTDKMIAFTQNIGPYRPSMLLDRSRGNPMELEALFLVPLAQAAAGGVSMPRTAMLYALLKSGLTPWPPDFGPSTEG